MCKPPNPFLIPFEFVFGFVGKNLQSWDEAIRANNLRIVELMHSNRNHLPKKETNSDDHHDDGNDIDFKQLNRSERDELTKLIIQKCIARIQMKDWKDAKQDLMQIISNINFCDDHDEDSIQEEEENQTLNAQFYITEYLMGICCDGLGEFSEAVGHFKNAIKCREEVEMELIKKGKEELEMNLSKLEEPFFVSNVEESNHNQKKGVRQRLGQYLINLTQTNSSATSKPSSFVSLELLYIRAGLSYYYETFYSNGIEYLNKAIILGEENNSELIESSYYNRGLCKYYSGDLFGAIDDFSKSISLMPSNQQKDQAFVMRASIYNRLGMSKEMNLDISNAKLINPSIKSLPLFHLRLLNEDNLNYLLPFLQTKQLLVLSSFNKYYRNVVRRFIQENDIELGKNSLYAEERFANRSIVSKLFLPKPTPPRVVLMEIMNNSLLLENVRNLRICSNYNVAIEEGGAFRTSFQILEHALKTFKDLKRLTVHRIHPTYGELVIEHSPNLVYLQIEEDCNYLDYNANLISKLPALEHLVLPQVCFRTNPFQNNTNLKVVEYRKIDNNNLQQKALTWEEIIELNPTITFIERKHADRLFLDEDSPSYFPINRK